MLPRTNPGTADKPAAPNKRRDLLTWLLGTWATGVVGAVVYPIARFLVPPEVPESTTLSASGGSASKLVPNSGRVVPFGPRPAIVIRTESGELRAFSGVCTHLTCTVQYRADVQHIWCACHNGHYDLTGRNISGPPPRPLQPYDVAVKDDEIIISRNA
jgi:Rieske Fe-S protein